MTPLKLLNLWFIFSLLFSLLFGFIGFNQPDNFINILNLMFGASTTMFSVSLSVITGLSFREVTKRSMRTRLLGYVKQIRHNLMTVYCTVFALLMLIFMWEPQGLFFGVFDFRAFVIAYTAFSLIFFTVNFLHMQKFREDLDEELIKCSGH